MQRDDGKNNDSTAVRTDEQLSAGDDHKLQSYDEEVDKLIEWLRDMPHLPNVNDRAWLRNCFIGRKLRIERTKESLDGYFCCRAMIDEFFGVRDPLGNDVQTAMRKTWFGFSTNLTDEGYQVIVTRNITDEDVPGRYLDQWTKYFYMCIDWNLKRETVNGVIIIYDMATTNKNEVLTQVTPNFLRKSLQCSTFFPYKLIQVHFINVPSYAAVVFNILKSLVPKKIQSRIFMHNNPSDVLQHIQKECVPSDLGGSDKSIQELGEFCKENIIAEREMFMNGILSLKADMEKKPKDTNSNEQSELFGFDGNFKQLNID
ncbi:retinaldehyde-binding protein 1-like [Aphis craccivora]|uniref:Retinaldehyde-binding protein 1-like n=1 Tax=Aphis craccivora TaxID=307492 RepID=A0A6G0ZJE8_APHCR|nr:retinaldehyde-binding protein 1-like [Aphis craccivora]